MAEPATRRRRLIAALLVAGTAAIYLPDLQNAPLFVSHDEVVYSLQAHAIASNGRIVGIPGSVCVYGFL